MSNIETIEQFYRAFQQKDYKAMQACYADHTTFSDPAFPRLDAEQVRAMWEMFCKNGTELDITYKNIWADGDSGRAEWTAAYRFSRTGRQVVNHIRAEFVFQDGKIVQHTDRFDFHRWAAQALGLPGLLLGWTPWLRAKVQRTGAKALGAYMRKRP